MDFLNAIILLLNYIFVPALTYGSQLALGSKGDADAISAVFANTNIAACAGAVVAVILTQLLYKKVDLTMVLNGALSGLVAITAGPDYP